ncbi:MAG: lysophospholipid acyltransferase family protein [Deltaproteobacteria bacterium]
MLIRTLFVWLIGLPVTIFLFILVIISLIFDRSGKAIHSIGRLWSRILLFLSGVTVEVKGLENILAGKPQIFASNHQGAFDILALQAFIPIQFRWVAKRSLFKIPIIGWSISRAGYVSMDRERAGSDYRSIETAAENVRNGICVLIFPEGTRSATGELLPFKRGGFLLAIKSGAPVVPLSIQGSTGIMRRGSLLIRPGKIKIAIGRPIQTAGADEKALMAGVRQAIEDGLS